MQELLDRKIHTFSMRSGLTESDFGWGTPTFAKMGREKIRLIRVFLELDVHVVICDVDVLWLRNPIPYFQGEGSVMRQPWLLWCCPLLPHTPWLPWHSDVAALWLAVTSA